jgi:hypothetical protein
MMERNFSRESSRSMHLYVPILAIAWLIAASPSPLEPLGRFDQRAIPESSGIVKSRRHPGIFWVHNDSGNPPALFAIRRDGRIVREFRLNTPNIDWEDIAIDDEGHLFVGDIGNNGGKLPIRMVYRVDEPDPDRPASGPLSISAASYYTFPPMDRFDAESLFIDKGATIIVAKRFDRREAELYAVPIDPPAPLLRPAQPRLVGRLPHFNEPATGADLSSDGRLLAVCSTAVTRVYQRKGNDQTWDPIAEVRYDAKQYEGICWDGAALILVSEGRGIDRIAEETWRGSKPKGARSCEVE